MYTGNRPQGPPISRSEKAQAKGGHVGIGRNDLWLADPRPPRGARPLVLDAIPGVFCST
jgi:hypothetical protein